MATPAAVAVFSGQGGVDGEVLFFQSGRRGVRIQTVWRALPAGEHGFHIHKAGDLRGEGCKLACDHFHVGAPADHGGPPGTDGPRHTGDLGNVSMAKPEAEYTLPTVSIQDLLGRSMIVHADPDDFGKGSADDSKKTGHSGARIACAVIGRTESCPQSGGAGRRPRRRTARVARG